MRLKAWGLAGCPTSGHSQGNETLTETEVAAIKASADLAFGPGCVVRLFGSRVDDTRRGGDIDLHVVAPSETATLDRELAFREDLKGRIGERRVDVVLRRDSFVPRPIDDVAIAHGMVL